jgi:hypothetical protein
VAVSLLLGALDVALCGRLVLSDVGCYGDGVVVGCDTWLLVRVVTDGSLVFYHGTTVEEAAHIVEHGLEVGHFPRCLTPDIEVARLYGEAVVEVRPVAGAELSAFEGCGEWEVLCWEPVPPARCEVVQGGL